MAAGDDDVAGIIQGRLDGKANSTRPFPRLRRVELNIVALAPDRGVKF